MKALVKVGETEPLAIFDGNYKWGEDSFTYKGGRVVHVDQVNYEIVDYVEPEVDVVSVNKNQFFKHAKALSAFGNLKVYLQTNPDEKDYFEWMTEYAVTDPEVINACISMGQDTQTFFNAAGKL